MSLSTFLDLVWVEIYDDCSPMGDRQQYRDVVTKLFLQGVDPHDIWITGSDGKKKRLTDTPRAKTGKSDIAALKALREQAIALAEARKNETE